jgi:glycine betaine/choline ABC-type transport system substrate-binding protein/serine/threonine protein kinase
VSTDRRCVAGASGDHHAPLSVEVRIAEGGLATMEQLRPEDPQVIGGCRIIGRLGEGGQGVVYKAQRYNIDVAIKLSHTRITDGRSDNSARFMTEISAVRRVARFCTARILDMGIEDGRPYIVSEFIEGRSLQATVEADGPLSGGDLERLAVGTVTALAATHAAGLVHRDFKPQNVLLGRDGARVVDFGVAFVLDAPDTERKGRLGTPPYMAPEQICCDEVTALADMFSWAVTMTFAATGSPAFGDDSETAVFNRILHTEPDLADLPSPMHDLIARCLAKDSRRRPPARDVLLGLLGYEGTVPWPTTVDPKEEEPSGSSGSSGSADPSYPYTAPRSATLERDVLMPSGTSRAAAAERKPRPGGRTSGQSWRRVLAGLTAVTLAGVTVTAVYWFANRGEDGRKQTPLVARSQPPVQLTVGSADFPENNLLAEIYAQALESKGLEIRRRFNIGPRETYFPLIKAGEIDVLPDYNGALTSYLGGLNVETTKPMTTEAIDDELTKVLPDNLTALDSAKAEDKDSITVTRQTAKTNDLSSIADLQDVSKDMVLGGAPEFEARHQGVIGLRAMYGVSFKDFQPFRLDDYDSLVKLLNAGSIQAAALFTTDPRIRANDLVVLDDPKHLFSSQNILPVVYRARTTPAAKNVLNAVSAKLTTDDLLYMNTRIAVNKDPITSVAKAWLTQVNII